jgi:hypothetical protein
MRGELDIAEFIDLLPRPLENVSQLADATVTIPT